MNARSFGRTWTLIVTLSGGLGAFACSSGDESLGRDQNAAQPQNNAGTTSQGEPSCETIQCLRAVECVTACGGPIVQSGCCPCADGMLDVLVDCPLGQGGAEANNAGAPGSGGHSGSTSPPSGGEGGYAMGGVGGDTGSVLDLNQLHSTCVDGACSGGLTAMEYYGFAGPGGPLFCSCEIPCEEDPNVCPPTTVCGVISDGPGAVCMAE